jgi:glycosyltransferase involved in cell wall biosynthesis
MIKIFDCSNSSERPPHRNGGGPLVNDVMRYLHENCEYYGFTFVNDPHIADVIITNDVFPKYILDLKKPLVKRMDGVFWHKDFVQRNHPLNRAAQQADNVIFITNYSRDSFFNTYNQPLKDYCVVRHWVDPKVFRRFEYPLNKKLVLCASATDWDREEKRYLSIIKLASMFKDQFLLNLIGKNSYFIRTSSNVTKYGYISDPKEMANIFNSSDGFVNLSYRDAATKTVPQAISCGLPILYAQSGGVHEMVGNYGVPIPEIENFDFIEYVPHLTEYQLEQGFKNYLSKFDDIRKSLKTFDPNDKFDEMLDGYFNAIKKVL